MKFTSAHRASSVEVHPDPDGVKVWFDDYRPFVMSRDRAATVGLGGQGEIAVVFSQRVVTASFEATPFGDDYEFGVTVGGRRYVVDKALYRSMRDMICDAITQ